MQPERRLPPKFALKELISPKVFPLGKNENIRDYLPLNEAAIQRYMRHSSIVETYWADVRCLHPETNEPLDVGVSELAGAWTPLDNLNDLEKTYEAAEQRHPGSLPYKEVKLQMRIAMEHCDLGAPQHLVVLFLFFGTCVCSTCGSFLVEGATTALAVADAWQASNRCRQADYCVIARSGV